jgi:hypothetical protein
MITPTTVHLRDAASGFLLTALAAVPPGGLGSRPEVKREFVCAR